MIKEEWYDNGQGFLGPEPFGLILPDDLEKRGVNLKALLIDYHWNYWRLRHNAEFEAKQYAVEEAADGRLISIDDGNDPPF